MREGERVRERQRERKSERERERERRPTVFLPPFSVVYETCP